MAKLPYGFDANPMFETRQPQTKVEAWERLDEVQLSLEKGEAVAPELAAWLGEAIHYAKRDPAELLRRLGVKRSRGPVADTPGAWLVYGQRVCELEYAGMKREAAMTAVLTEANDVFSRSTLQKWRKAYQEESQRKVD